MISFTREHRLYVILAGFFVTNAILAEMIGVKIFSFEKLIGITPFNFTFFGQDQLAFNLTAGVLLWPIVFIMTDLINEYFGVKGVRKLSWLTVCLILYAFLAIFAATNLPPADFWITSHLDPTSQSNDFRQDVLNYNSAFRLVFNQGMFIIIGSVVAFLVGQILDVTVFHWIKKKTGEKAIWLRATGSTVVSQLIDSFIVLFIAFYIGANWPIQLVLAICMVNYIYKFSVAILITPVLYIVHDLIERYLGHELATEMKAKALM